MKKGFILVALFTSLALWSCNNDKTKSDGVIDNSGFDDDGEVLLNDFSQKKMPDYDVWVINDTEATTEDFVGLSAALTTLSNDKKEKDRQISLVFPNLTEIPDFAIFGREQGKLIYNAQLDTYYYNYNTWIDYSKYNASVVVSISAPVAESVGSHAFAFCYNLTSIDFPETKELGDGALIYSSLSSLDVSQFPQLEEIGMSSFSSCLKLETVDIPYVTSIGPRAFELCSKVESITAEVATEVGEFAFNGCSLLDSVELPVAEKVDYAAFFGCSSLASISLPAATYLGKWVFSSCDVLDTVLAPQAQYIGEQAFYNCSGLTSLEFTKATSVGSGAFYGCTTLDTLELPVAQIVGSDALRECVSLTSVELPALEVVSSQLFFGCSALTSVKLESATTINSSAFYGCSDLSELWLATKASVALKSIDVTSFLKSDPTNISLTLGSANSQFVEGTTLSVGSTFTQDFSSITLL